MGEGNPPDAGAAERTVRELLRKVGVEVDGSAPHDIQVHDRRFYKRILRDGSLGFGESYVDGWWDADAVDALVHRLFAGDIARATRGSPAAMALALLARLRNPQSLLRASRNARHHYERGLDLFGAMLDPRMTYSCAYWKNAGSLEEAQEAKLDLICRKLDLHEGKTLLDIGCGWGSLVGYAAETYGVRVTGITVSPEQAEVARARCAGLPVEIRVQDYREVAGKYDGVASVGMFEHVGPKNYRTYMEVVRRCLAPGGVSLLHTIGGSSATHAIDPWMERYVFPGANLPTLAQIARAAEGLLNIEDVHSFGPDYDRTLVAWHERFEAAWPSLRSRYDETFRRLWRFYLLSCAAAFRARTTHVFQVLLTERGESRPCGADVR
jgi:cyclopropane-fatty-acyl-phospholipid synthase